MPLRGPHKRGKQRMRRQRLGFELGMKLAAQEPRMVGDFDDLHVAAVGRAPGDAQPRGHQLLFDIRD